MENILHRIESRLDDLTAAVHQLKTENEILRKEILGVSSSADSEGIGLMESRTLREIVEKTEFLVKKIEDDNLSKEIKKENPIKSKSKFETKTIVKEESTEESEEEFEVKEIRSKTETEETEFLKATFNKFINVKKAKDGESLRGTSVQTISNSIPFSEDVKTSCTIKLTNSLDFVLSDPQYHFWFGSKNSGPPKVDGSFSEVFHFKGDSISCRFLCSFAISRVLRLLIRCESYFDGYIYLGIGFNPADVSTDQTLNDKLLEISPAPDVWFPKKHSEVPLERFVTHGNLLLRGHMSNGPRSIVHVEILEFNPVFGSPRSLIGGKQRIVDGKTLEMFRSPQKSRTNSKSIQIVQKFSCVVEIVNCLSVPLSSPNNWYCNSEENNRLPLEILALHRESFFASGETNFEAMFSYEIISSDLALVIALKVGSGGKSFAAAFVPIPAVTEKKELDALMGKNQWKTHEYKTNANANEGMQLIAIRNIRAEILMTEEEKSLLNIRIFAV